MSNFPAPDDAELDALIEEFRAANPELCRPDARPTIAKTAAELYRRAGAVLGTPRRRPDTPRPIISAGLAANKGG